MLPYLQQEQIQGAQRTVQQQQQQELMNFAWRSKIDFFGISVWRLLLVLSAKMNPMRFTTELLRKLPQLQVLLS